MTTQKPPKDLIAAFYERRSPIVSKCIGCKNKVGFDDNDSKMFLCGHTLCKFCIDLDEHSQVVACKRCIFVSSSSVEDSNGSCKDVMVNAAGSDSCYFLKPTVSKEQQLEEEAKEMISEMESVNMIKGSDVESYESWKINTAVCRGCLNRVPHSQLFVCRNASCEHTLMQRVSFSSPDRFFKFERIYCGMCSLKGVHKDHASSVESALSLAIKLASRESGESLQKEFSESMTLDPDHPFDYTIADVTGKDQLPTIPVAKYMSSSKSVQEWLEREEQIKKLKELMITQRKYSKEYLEEMANSTLREYMQLVHITRNLVDTNGNSQSNGSSNRESLDWNESSEKTQSSSEHTFSFPTEIRSRQLNMPHIECSSGSSAAP